MSLRIHDTLTRELQTFVPLQLGRVGMYVCGMTVYDYCHLGHARSMIAFALGPGSGVFREGTVINLKLKT